MRLVDAVRGVLLVATSASGCVESVASVADRAVDATSADAATAAEEDSAVRPPELPLDLAIPRVALQQRGALGFCIKNGQLMSADIEGASPSEPASLQAHVFRSWSVRSESCLKPPTYCADLESRERTLSTAQRRELSAAIAELPATGCDHANTIVCDPCLITEVQVDGRSYVFDGGCSRGCQAVLRLAAVLDRLASDPPAADAADCYAPGTNLERVGQDGGTGCTCELPGRVDCTKGVPLECTRINGSGWGRWGERSGGC